MDRGKMRELSSSTCIVGVDESDEIGALPGKSQLTLHVEAIHNAARDAGLKPPASKEPSGRDPTSVDRIAAGFKAKEQRQS